MFKQKINRILHIIILLTFLFSVFDFKAITYAGEGNMVSINIESFSIEGLAGLNLWLKADSIEDRYEGDLVELWNDSSGMGNHANQSNESYRPVYKEGQLTSYLKR